MNRYLITDQPAPGGTDEKCFTFDADCFEEALDVFNDAVANGDAGYSEYRTGRINPKLWLDITPN